MTPEEKLIKKIAGYSTIELCKLYEETNNRIIDIDLAMVRGRLMDELEKRDTEKFLEWIDTDKIEKMDMPSHFFTREWRQ